MKYFELKCKTFIKNDIELIDSFDILSKYINFSLCQIEKYEKMHNSNKYKNYCFGSFYPIEKNKVYKAGNIYEFTIRSLDELFINDLENLLRQNINNSHLQVIQISKNYKDQFLISELYSITPVVISVKDENSKTIYWTKQKDGNINKLQKQLQDNLEKKYQDFYGEKIEKSELFMQYFEIKNTKPQSIFFTKDSNKVRLFGNKFKIVPNTDEVSQKLAFIALSCGLGEKQSYGAGMCISREMR